MITASIGSAVLLMIVLPLIVGYGAYVYGRFTSQRKYLAEIEEQHQTICRLRLLSRMQVREDNPTLGGGCVWATSIEAMNKEQKAAFDEWLTLELQRLRSNT